MVEKTTGKNKAKTNGKSKKASDKAVKQAMTPPSGAAPPSGAGTVIPMFGNEGGPALAVAPAEQPEPKAVKIADITPSWATAKAMETRGKKEADACRKKILNLVDNDTKKLMGYKDENLEIDDSPDIDYNDPKLTTALKEEGLWDSVKIERAEAKLVQSVSLTNPRIKEILNALGENRKLVFRQVKDKDGD